MKWFVTDAQLAQMRGDIEANLRNAFAVWYAGREAEIQRLREDRAAELARMVDPQGPFVQHLRDEVEFWRMQFRHERQRSEIALDQCRITHQGIGPVSAPPREERLPSQFPASEESALASLNMDGM